jgi:hypothetical protein
MRTLQIAIPCQNSQAYVLEGDRLRELLNLYDDEEKKAKARADLILHLENPVKLVSFSEFVISPPSSALMAPPDLGMYKFIYVYVYIWTCIYISVYIYSQELHRKM